MIENVSLVIETVKEAGKKRVGSAKRYPLAGFVLTKEVWSKSLVCLSRCEIVTVTRRAAWEILGQLPLVVLAMILLYFYDTIMDPFLASSRKRALSTHFGDDRSKKARDTGSPSNNDSLFNTSASHTDVNPEPDGARETVTEVNRYYEKSIRVSA